MAWMDQRGGDELVCPRRWRLPSLGKMRIKNKSKNGKESCAGPAYLAKPVGERGRPMKCMYLYQKVLKRRDGSDQCQRFSKRMNRS